MTVSKSHPIKKTGLEKVLEDLKNAQKNQSSLNLLFVVPEAICGENSPISEPIIRPKKI